MDYYSNPIVMVNIFGVFHQVCKVIIHFVLDSQMLYLAFQAYYFLKIVEVYKSFS
jgi:hypothetical protein